jgi:3-hydroxyacyl-CoA dehydrogenase / enoyl-CoA hydratase / 3-hydroxybutyryl-CoA epimerase
LSMVRGFCAEARTATHEQMFERCGRLGRQNVRLEASSKPWVAAVNGLALGGGLELAMSCRERLVSDDRRIQLGLPEIRWGLLPGAGGTQRLPRMVGYALGMELLLTGRSLSPQEAVDCGLFRQAVPADRLLDEARQVARSLIGTPYRPADKFRHLDQADVPPYTAETARAEALRLGVRAEDFELYPAYSAIVDSVLKGARQPLAEANATEMHEFLRLMFSAVAGRMVRILFLERLRAERVLAAPADIQPTALRHGPISPPRQAWADALAKLKLDKVADASLPPDTLDIVDAQGKEHRLQLRVLDEAPVVQAQAATAVLAPSGPYGRVMEIVGPQGAASQAAAALAGRMWTLAWHAGEASSLLQALRGQPLSTQAALAVQWAARTDALEPTFLDVAACLAGVAPGWSGGPLSWLWDERENEVPRFDPETRAAWERVSARIEQACA